LYKDPLLGEKPPKKGQPENQKALQRPAYAGSTDLHDKYLSPVYGSFNHFPPMLIQVGTYEILESDAINVAEKAKNAGVNVTLTRYEGMFHVFQHVQFLPESKRAWKEVEGFIKKLN
jgi:acetyl esterase/lipase